MNTELPFRKPNPKVEIAQDIRTWVFNGVEFYLDWPTVEDNGPWRVFVFTLGGGLLAGCFVILGRWCQKKCDTKRKKYAVLPPSSPKRKTKVF